MKDLEQFVRGMIFTAAIQEKGMTKDEDRSFWRGYGHAAKEILRKIPRRPEGRGNLNPFSSPREEG